MTKKRSASPGRGGQELKGPELDLAISLVRAQLADPRFFPRPAANGRGVASQLLSLLKAGFNVKNAALAKTVCVLLLGEAGSGKTHTAEWCLQELKKVQKQLVVLRAHGQHYSSETELIHHIANQVSSEVVAEPMVASFDQGMEWLRNLLREGCRSRPVVLILDHFESFCSRARQTLLYNLFELAQEAGVMLSIIGLSRKMDVTSCLEKRIRSRFSSELLLTSLPKSMDQLTEVLMSKLRLPTSCGLSAEFLEAFHEKLQESLLSQGPKWQDQLESGHSPSWFLNDLSLAQLFGDKRLRAGNTDQAEVRDLLAWSLAESDHILLLAFLLLRDRQAPRSLCWALHEIEKLHDGSNFLYKYNEDTYRAAFSRLLGLKLLSLGQGPSRDTMRHFLPCESSMDAYYEILIRDLERSKPLLERNPLTELPFAVQQWAVRNTKESSAPSQS